MAKRVRESAPHLPFLIIKKSKHELVTESPKFEKAPDQARRLAVVDTPVLILGEGGSGKEVMARYIHDHSKRHKNPFLAVN